MEYHNISSDNNMTNFPELCSFHSSCTSPPGKPSKSIPRPWSSTQHQHSQLSEIDDIMDYHLFSTYFKKRGLPQWWLVPTSPVDVWPSNLAAGTSLRWRLGWFVLSCLINISNSELISIKRQTKYTAEEKSQWRCCTNIWIKVGKVNSFGFYCW